MVKRLLQQKLEDKFPGLNFDVLIPPDEKMGDYSANIAFALAKKEDKNPLKAGEEMAAALSKDKDLAGIFEKIEAVKPGFVNFFLKKEFLQSKLAEIYKNLDSFGTSDVGKGKTVIVEYSSPNIAKPMHIGHLRSTIIGDALANVYEALGYKVIRWNYIGDWGTQFGKLIVAYTKWLDKDSFDKNPINEMARLYVKFHEEVKINPGLEDEAREAFAILEGVKGMDETYKRYLEIWNNLRRVSLEEFSVMYKNLGLTLFNKNNKNYKDWGESKFAQNLKYTLGFLGKLGLLTESEGAKIVNLEKFNLLPALIWKSDGAGLYLAREIATLRDRIENYFPHKIIYVVANQQTLHFQQLFAVADLVRENDLSKKLLRGDWSRVELVHVKFGMVLGEDGKKLATREGKVVLLREVIDKITALALKVVKEKNTELSGEQIDEVAKAVGIGALKYNDLKQHPHTDIVFNWEAMLDISGNSGPYLQYTYARLKSIWFKSSKRSRLALWFAKRGIAWLVSWIPLVNLKIDRSKLIKEQELTVTKQLLKFPDVVSESANSNSLNNLALYLYNLASQSNYYYETVRILSDVTKRPERNARLMLVETVAAVLERGLDILGIKTLKRI